MNEKTANLGPEWDQAIRRRLRFVVKKMGGVERSRSCGVGGSQELEEVIFALGNQCITVRAETYCGIEIVGSPELVDEVVAMVAARRTWLWWR